MAKSLESNFFSSLKFYCQNFFFLFTTYLIFPLVLLLISMKFVSKKPKSGSRILVLQTAKIGDMVCTTPVFREIKKKYPESFLAVLIISKTSGLIFNNPYIDKIIFLDDKKYKSSGGVFRLIKDLARERYDWSVSLNPNLLNNILPFWSLIPKRISFTSKYLTKSTRLSYIFVNRKKEFLRIEPAFRQYLGILDFMRIRNANEKKDVFISKEAEQKARDFLAKNKVFVSDFLVGISVGSGNPLKDWDLEKFSQLADKLIVNLKAKVIFVGSPQESELIAKTISLMKNPGLNASGEFRLDEIAGLMQNFKMFISVDTGPLYIADALGVGVVDIIGPFNVIEQLDLNGKCAVVSKNLYCFPCVHIMPSVYQCQEGHFRCTRDISADDVYQAVLKLKNKYGL